MNKRRLKKRKKKEFHDWRKQHFGEVWLICEGYVFKRYQNKEAAKRDLPYKDPSTFTIYIPEEDKLYLLEDYAKKSS